MVTGGLVDSVHSLKFGWFGAHGRAYRFSHSQTSSNKTKQKTHTPTTKTNRLQQNNTERNKTKKHPNIHHIQHTHTIQNTRNSNS